MIEIIIVEKLETRKVAILLQLPCFFFFLFYTITACTYCHLIGLMRQLHTVTNKILLQI